MSVHDLSPVRTPAISSHGFAGGLQPASYQSAGLTHTTQDLAVLHIIIQALPQHYTCSSHLVVHACQLHGCITQCCSSCGFKQMLAHEKVPLSVLFKHVTGFGLPCFPMASTISNKPQLVTALTTTAGLCSLENGRLHRSGLFTVFPV